MSILLKLLCGILGCDEDNPLLDDWYGDLPWMEDVDDEEEYLDDEDKYYW